MRKAIILAALAGVVVSGTAVSGTGNDSAIFLECTYQETFRGDGKPDLFPLFRVAVENGEGRIGGLDYRENCLYCIEQLTITPGEILFRSGKSVEWRINRLTGKMLYQAIGTNPLNFVHIYQCEKFGRRF